MCKDTLEAALLGPESDTEPPRTVLGGSIPEDSEDALHQLELGEAKRRVVAHDLDDPHDLVQGQLRGGEERAGQRA